MSTGYHYTNIQRTEIVDAIGDLITLNHAARLLDIRPGTLDKVIRKEGYCVVMVGKTRLIWREDLTAIKQDLDERFKELNQRRLTYEARA